MSRLLQKTVTEILKQRQLTSIGVLIPLSCMSTYLSFLRRKKEQFQKRKNFIFHEDAHFWLWNKYDLTFEALHFYREKHKKKLREIAQQVDESIWQSFGPNLAAANFFVYGGGKVKFSQDIIWHQMSENGSSTVPKKYVEGYDLEAIDASKMYLYLNGLDYLKDLTHLKYLKLPEHEFVNDWYLAKIAILCPGLEYLDIRNCQQVTDFGLAALSSMNNLKGLNITGCTKLKTADGVCTLLEEKYPELVIIGLDTLPKTGEILTTYEIENSRFLNLGHVFDNNLQLNSCKKSVLEEVSSCDKEASRGS